MHRLADPVLRARTPSDTVQKLLQPIAGHLWSLLTNVHAAKVACERVLELEDESVFNVMFRQAGRTGSHISLAETSEVYENLTLYHRMQEWLAFCTLACPWEVMEGGHWDIVVSRLTDGFVLPIFREHAVYLHVEWQEFLERWKPSQSALKARIKAVKPDKVIKSLEKDAILHFAGRHKLRRLLLHQVQCHSVVPCCAAVDNLPRVSLLTD